MTVNLDDILARVDRVNEHRKGGKLSDQALSLGFGKSRDLIRNWRAGKAKLPSLDTLEKGATYLGVSPGWLAFGDAAGGEARELPLISQVAAGSFTDVGDIDASAQERILVDGLGKGTYFALRVKGDSMDMIAPERSIIVVDASARDLVPRKCYVFRRFGEATFKQYMANPARLEPLSFNRQHEVIPANDDIQIIGKVVKIIQDIS